MTYIIQFNYGGYWDTYEDDNNSNITFNAVSHADKVKDDRIRLNKWAREKWDDIPEIYEWRIVNAETKEVVSFGKAD